MKRWLKLLAFAAAGFAVFVVAMRLLFPLPGLEGWEPSTAIPVSAETRLGRRALEETGHAPGTSGIYPLFRGTEAYAARILLARAAERSLDVRYYIWQRDQTGLPLLGELRAAAARGVRVRLLVDDNGTPDLDAELSALNALDNLEVRVFNPFNIRSPRLASYLFDFPRLNRRMHNKSFTADGALTIVGGRNVGDIYFSRDSETQYSDFDLLLAGPAAQDVGTDFDLYWNSASAYPHDSLMEPDPGGLDRLDAGIGAATTASGWAQYAAELQNSALVVALRTGDLDMEWAPVELVSDDPAKGLGRADADGLMIVRLSEIVGRAQRSIDLVSAYFIPGERGTDLLVAAAQRGLRVRTLTNSMAATDVLPVHAGYARYRDRLVDAGVSVYELKPTQSPTQSEALGLIGSSAASLHAKTFALDGNRIFVGSFNFDPRSVMLNCEMGFLVRSERLAAQFVDNSNRNLDSFAWRVTRAPSGDLQWTTEVDGVAETVSSEPDSNLVKRVMLAIITLLPVEWML